MERVLADSRDRDSWLKARFGNVGGSNAATFARAASAPQYAKRMLHEQFAGNQYTRHGNDREAAVLRHFGVDQNFLLFRSEDSPRHVATPDGIQYVGSELVLIQCKTSLKPLELPPTYRRQIAWEQYVLGAAQTLLVWEQHENFMPARMEPESLWVPRYDALIANLIEIADLVTANIDAVTQFENEMRQNHDR